MTTSTTQTRRTQQWRERIAQQAASGKSITAFCREQGIATQTFYGWRHRLARRDAGTVAAPAVTPFVELGVMPAATQDGASLSIRLDLPGGITLTIAQG